MHAFNAKMAGAKFVNSSVSTSSTLDISSRGRRYLGYIVKLCILVKQYQYHPKILEMISRHTVVYRAAQEVGVENCEHIDRKK